MPTTDEPSAAPRLPGLERVVYGEREIEERVRQLGRSVTEFYRDSVGRDLRRSSGTGSAGDGLLILGVLKGSFVFMADLVRTIELPVEVDFIVAASYGSGTVTSGEVELLYEPDVSLGGRDVLLVEDIVDSGTTLNRLVPELERKEPRSLELCALLYKEGRRGPGSGPPGPSTVAPPGAARPPEPRWIGFRAPDEFLVGYGLDYGESYRHLPYIASILEDEPVSPDRQ